jgi:hypothetical protein
MNNYCNYLMELHFSNIKARWGAQQKPVDYNLVTLSLEVPDLRK